MGNVVSIAVCHETRTDVGFINVIVMFSGATRMEPSKKRNKNIIITNSIIQKEDTLVFWINYFRDKCKVAK